MGGAIEHQEGKTSSGRKKDGKKMERRRLTPEKAMIELKNDVEFSHKKIDTQISRGKAPGGVLSLKEWEQIEDILREVSSVRLQKSITKAREDYKKGSAIPYAKIRK